MIGGRTAVLIAVSLQAAGKVAYGTWLGPVPAPLFVFVSFALAAALFTVVSGRAAGRRSIGHLVLLNASTAITFLAFFHALKLIEPAIVGAIEIGVGPPLVLLVAYLLHGARPEGVQGLVCAGILLGCATLAAAAYLGSGVATGEGRAVEGIIASATAGAGAVAITMVSKVLMERGWSRGAVLAHRFYLIVPLALFLALRADAAPVVWTAPVVGAILLIAAFGVVLPLYLLQLAIERSDAYTVISTMAALPVITFALEAPSPAYHLSWPTAAGVLLITVTLMLAARSAHRSAATPNRSA